MLRSACSSIAVAGMLAAASFSPPSTRAASTVGSLVAQGRYQALAQEGPGTSALPPGTRIVNLQEPAVNARGEASFFAAIDDGDRRDALLISSGGALHALAITEDQAPHYPAGFFHSRFGTWNYLADSGETIFESLVTNAAETQITESLYAASPPAGVRELLREGQSLVGPRGVAGIVQDIGLWSASRTGRVVFRADLIDRVGSTAPAVAGIWRLAPNGDSQLLVAAGTAIPGLPPGATIGLNPQSNSYISITDQGRVGLLAQIGSGFTRAVVVSEAGDPTARAVLYQGQLVGPGVTLGLFEPPVINDAGGVLVRGSVTGLGGSTTSRGAVISAGATPFVLLAEGAAPLGLPPSTTIAQIGGFELQNDNTTLVALRLQGAGIDAFNDEGVWRSDAAGRLTPLLREGAELANLPGVVLGSFDGRPSSLSEPTRIDAGFLLRSKLRGPGIVGSFDDALVLVGNDGAPLLIARDGDPYQAGSQSLFISDVDYRGFAPQGQGVASNGYFAFTTGDAILAVQIPEPATAPLAAALIAFLCCRARRPI